MKFDSKIAKRTKNWLINGEEEYHSVVPSEHATQGSLSFWMADTGIKTRGLIIAKKSVDTFRQIN